jgi:Fe-S-cluster containining protein
MKPLPKYITDILKQGKEAKKAYANWIKKNHRKGGIEKQLPALHDEAFRKVNCLDCANCCKTISPRFKTPDIKRISKFLSIKESSLINEYLLLDEDGDYIVKSRPCPFLNEDNYCNIYDVRPSDCSKYPYTDSGDFFKYPNTTVLNIDTCPAVVLVLEKLSAVSK